MAGVGAWIFSYKGVVLKNVFMGMRVMVLLNKHCEMLTCLLILSQIII